jgi:hypothetical protein
MDNRRTKTILMAKILLTIAAIQYGIMPVVADFSETHLFHPEWTPHARFHLVWLLGLGGSLATYVVISVWLLSRSQLELLKHTSLLGCFVLGAFFVAVSGQSAYGGSLTDLAEPNAIMGINANVFSFTIASLFQLIAVFLIWFSKENTA